MSSKSVAGLGMIRVPRAQVEERVRFEILCLHTPE